MRKLWLALVCCVVGLQSHVATASGDEPIIIRTLPEDASVYQGYLDFVAGRQVDQIDNFAMQNEAGQREIVEMVLMQQALKKGGLHRPVHFKPLAKFYNRNIHELIKGRFLMSSDSVWFKDISEHANWLYITEAIIAKGQFEAGLYTSAKNMKAMRAKKADLVNLTAVSNPQWSADWSALTSIRLKEIESIGEWYYMVKLVDARMVDFMLAPFSSSEDLSINVENMRIVPIPKIKMILPDSRHFAVSKSHPDGRVVYEALNSGMKLLKEEGAIVKAYQEAGVFNQQVTKWKVANRHVLEK